MIRWFNTAGPCQADIHYMLPPLERLQNLERLIDQRSYFVLHAPRQTGKTTAMLALAQKLTNSGQYTAALVSVEMGSAFGEDIDRAEAAILGAWSQTLPDRLPSELQPPPWPEVGPGQRIRAALRSWVISSPRPVVLLIDEIDSLIGATLISVLRQLRDGYPNRPQSFPQSIGLIGLRDVRDYKRASGGSENLNTSSPFNIKVESLTLRNFTAQEVAELCGQHTAATGQIFTPEALKQIYHLTSGQPWLVNAIARQLVEVIVPEPEIALTVEHVYQAKEILIQRRDTHIDSLAERLREPRVQRVIEPMLAGQQLTKVSSEDIDFLLDLGLCQVDAQGSLKIANPIYQEIIPRVLAFSTTVSLPQISPVWLKPDGSLNPEVLLQAFLNFWRQHGQPLLRDVSYHEVAPHIVLMAFLHRVVNGGGTLEREYAIGTGKMDLCLRYGAVTLGMELKVWRSGEKDPLSQGLEQLEQYLSGLGLTTGWLVIFDQRKGIGPIADRTTAEVVHTTTGREVVVIRA